MLLQKEIAHDVIVYAISLGADYCELFIEKTINQFIVYNSLKIKDITSGIGSDIGVLLIYGHLVLSAFSNSIKKDLMDRVNKLGTQFTRLKVVDKMGIDLSPNDFRNTFAQLIRCDNLAVAGK